MPNSSDSCARGHGQKTHLACHQFDYTCGIVATPFDASVDVTEAANRRTRIRVRRSHRSWFAHPVACFGVSDRIVNLFLKSDSGHALLSGLGRRRFTPGAAITFAFNGRPPVFNLTVPLDGVPPTGRIKSRSRRCVGPTRARRYPLLALVVTTDARSGSFILGDVRGDRSGWRVTRAFAEEAVPSFHDARTG